MNFKSIVAPCAALALSALCLAAQAAPETFFGEDQVNGNAATARPLSDAAQNSFLSRLSSSRTENFEATPTGIAPSLTVNLGAAGTATLTSSGMEVMSVASDAGRFATSGSKYLKTAPGFTVTFSQPQTAFGFMATDVGDFNGRLQLVYSNGSSQTVSVPHATGVDGTVLFFGLIDEANPFTSVVFNNSDTGDIFGFDDLVAGLAVALPSITTTGALPDGTVGQAYSQPLAATGGRAPLVWSATGLPAGLSIDPATGVISGTPTAVTATPASVVVTVTDSTSPTPLSASQTLSLAVAAAPFAGSVQAVPSLGSGALAMLGLLAAGLGARRQRARNPKAN